MSNLAGTAVSVLVPGRRGLTNSAGSSSSIPYSTAISRSTTGPLSSGSGGWTPAELFLTDTTLYYEVKHREGQRCEVFLEDLLGVHISSTPLLYDGRACQLNIHLFPIYTKKFTKKKVRKLADTPILFDAEKAFDDNFKMACEWKNKILCQAEKATRATFEQSGFVPRSSRHSSDGEDSELPTFHRRHFVVFINPMAGVQRGESDFYTHVKPMFDLAEIDYDVKITDHQNHAHAMIQTMDLSSIDGIVIGSGDGLLYELINGIMKRPDWETVIKIPVGMLPLGSGNALAASTLCEAKEIFSMETAAFQIIRGGYSHLDLTTIHTADGGTCYMALLGAWGLVADVDIESEKMRKIGELRFLLGALNAIRKKKVYRGKLSYLVPDHSSNTPDVMSEESFKPPPSDTVYQTCDDNSRPSSSSAAFSDFETCSEMLSDNDVPSDIVQLAETNMPYSEIRQDSKQAFSRPLADLLVPLSSPLPKTWVTREDDFLNISFITVPFLSRTVIGDPELEVGSGKIRIVWIDGAATRFHALKVLTGSETGKHIEMDQVKLIDAKAFRIEPITSGIMTIDGEEVFSGPIQGQIHPHMGYVMSRKRSEQSGTSS